MQTFGDHLYQFAKSVDIVPRDVYQDVLTFVESRLHADLKASTFAVVNAKLRGMDPYLFVEDWWSEPVRNPDGTYEGQAAFAYGTGKPLWIVAADHKSTLYATADYEDLLGNVESSSIPKYVPIPRSKAQRLRSSFLRVSPRKPSAS